MPDDEDGDVRREVVRPDMPERLAAGVAALDRFEVAAEEVAAVAPRAGRTERRSTLRRPVLRSLRLRRSRRLLDQIR